MNNRTECVIAFKRERERFNRFEAVGDNLQVCQI